MASPTPVGTPTETAITNAGTSHVVNLPSGTPGNMFVAMCDKGSTAATVNALAGWNELLDENLANGLYIAVREVDGTEGATTTFTLSAATRGAWIVYEVSGQIDFATQAPQIGTTASGSSVNPNPPSVNVTGGAKDILSIACFGRGGEEADDDTWVTAAPAGYGSLLQKACGTAGTNLGGMIATAHREVNAGSEDPGNFTCATGAWRAQTIVIHPVATVEYTDSATALVTFTPSGTELTAKWYEDTDTAVLALTASGTEFITHEYVDSATATVKLTPGGVVERHIEQPIGQFSDDFDDNTYTGVWIDSSEAPNSVTETGNQIVLHTESTIAEFATLHTLDDFSLIDSYCRVECVSIPSVSTHALLFMYFSQHHSYEFHYKNGVLTGQLDGGAIEAGDSVGACPRFLRLRHVSADELIYYEYSSDGVNWTELTTTPVTAANLNSGWLDSGKPEFMWRQDSAGSGQDAVVDNFNKLISLFTDAATATVTLTPSATEVKAHDYTDTETALVTLTPSATEVKAHDYVDTETATLVLSPSASEIAEFVDTNTAAVLFTPSAIETREISDAETSTVTLTPSAADVVEFVDAETGIVKFTPSGTDQGDFVDSATEDFKLTPSGVDEYTGAGGTEFTDSATTILALSPASTESADTVDAGLVGVVLNPAGEESYGRSDADTTLLALSPNAVEVVDWADSATETFALIPSGTDEHQATTLDSATVVVLLTPSALGELVDSGTVVITIGGAGFDVQKIFQLYVVAVYRRFSQVKTITRFHNKNLFRRWSWKGYP